MRCLPLRVTNLIREGDKWIHYDSENDVSHDYTEQRDAVAAMLASKDKVFALRGVAGAGKTSALKEFHRGVAAASKQHILLAPTTKAVEALRRELPEVQVSTIEAFLLKAQSGNIDLADSVLTVDEGAT